MLGIGQNVCHKEPHSGRTDSITSHKSSDLQSRLSSNSFCISGWPLTCDPPASTFQVLELQLCAITPGLGHAEAFIHSKQAPSKPRHFSSSWSWIVGLSSEIHADQCCKDPFPGAGKWCLEISSSSSWLSSPGSPPFPLIPDSTWREHKCLLKDGRASPVNGSLKSYFQ